MVSGEEGGNFLRKRKYKCISIVLLALKKHQFKHSENFPV
jgi:hypothetical protein